MIVDYQISFLSKQGYAKELAYCFKCLFPSRTPVIDLSKSTKNNSKIHLIGYEYIDNDLDDIPEAIKSFLHNLNNKEVLLFATSPICTSENKRRNIERQLMNFIPIDCLFHGLFLCQGEINQKEIERLIDVTNGLPRDSAERKLLSTYRKSKGHPNREDIRHGYRFISSELQLDTYV